MKRNTLAKGGTHICCEKVPEEKQTIVAKVAIKCHDLFQVKDASSGSALQGMEDSSEQEEVDHIVWFKIVTDESQDGAGRDIVRWKIINVDDLPEGNMFI
jgi:hypothetical protein